MTFERQPVLLKVLSGPHRGAELELAPGDWIMGADTACDLVLSDPDVHPEHLRLHVEGSGERGVRLYPLHGAPVLLDGLAVAEEGVELPVYTVFQLGGTHACIGPSGEIWPEIFLPVVPEEQSTGEPMLLPEADSMDEPLRMEPLSTEESHTEELSEDTPGNAAIELEDPASNPDGEARPRRKFWIMLPVVLVLLALLMTGTSWLGLFAPSLEGQVEQLRQNLRNSGFTAVQADLTPENQVLVTGAVPLAADRERLETLLQGFTEVPFADSRITVVDAQMRELQRAFEQAGARLRVDRNGVQLRVSGYIHDREQLENLLTPYAEALSEVPLKLSPVFWEELSPELNRLVGPRELQQVVRFEPSTLFVVMETQRLNAAQQSALAQFEAEITDFTQGVSPFERRSEGSAPVPTPVISPRPDKPVQIPLCQRLEFAGDRLKLDGETYREGGRIPGGYRISELTGSYVVFMRDGNNMLICRKR